MSSFVFDKFFSFYATCLHERTEGVEHFIPVVEKRLKVRHGFKVVHVVFRRATYQPERKPVVHCERELVSDVGFDADDDAEQHVAPGRQGVTVEEPGVGGGEEPHGDQLPRV